MVDEFARLRGELYVKYAGDATEQYRRLACALTGEHGQLDPILDSMVKLHAYTRENSGGSVAGHPRKIGGASQSGPALLNEALERLGESPYTDRYLADLVRSGAACEQSELERLMLRRSSERGGDRPWFAFGSSTGLRSLDHAVTRRALNQRGDPETLIDALGYVAAAGLNELIPDVEGVVDAAVPWGVRAEALLTLAELWQAPAVDRPPGAQSLTELSERAARAGLNGVLDALVGCPVESERDGGAGIAQSVFYGDPSRIGKGGSGGIATLVRELGGVLAANHLPVVTLVCYDSHACGYPLNACETVSPDHVVLRLPIYLQRQDPFGFLQAEHRIARAAARALRANAGRVRAVHVRFLDDASRAVARVARVQGVPVVMTLTPDPHRTVCGPGSAIVARRTEEAREIFNRVLIGDELLSWSRGVLAIGRHTFAKELIKYFPQLEDARGKVTAAIDEGVNTDPSPVTPDPEALLCDSGLDLPLARGRLSAPILITVGRLSPVKGQVNLVRAWAESPLHERYNLVLVGGDSDSPSPEERAIQDEIRSLRRPETVGRLCHLPAQSNHVVRGLLSWCASRELEDGLDLYVCSSLKEEFGLSILEAMAAGMPVCAPLRGGPRTYIRHGVNGFLIDTGDASRLQSELCALLTGRQSSPAHLARVKRKARRTVEEHYSLNAMAARYEQFYGRVIGGSSAEEGAAL